MGTNYDKGEFVYQFAADPDEKYTGKGFSLQAKPC